MSNVVICGVGQMGYPIAYGMCELGHKVTIFDKDDTRINSAFHNLKSFGYKVEHINHLEEIPKKTDIVISALPYHANLEVAQLSIEQSWMYVDLGGDLETEELIIKMGEKAENQIFPSLGLAPGLVNILAEQVYNAIKQAPVDHILMYCGGLPSAPHDKDLLGYTSTWSIDGLYNEYKGSCDILLHGDIYEKSALSGLEDFNFGMYTSEHLEAFLTKGGGSQTIKLMRDRGVKHCFYKTIRYKGHNKIVDWLINHVKLQPNKLKSLIDKEKQDDIVYIKVVGGNVSPKYDSQVQYSLMKRILPMFGFSAMQVGTAFPLCAIAHMMVEGEIGETLSPVLNYANVPLGGFYKYWNFLTKE